mmetsp:Transcript_17121/g.28881  ORF Transcript_17121/g.28881 Transcript_17121/m.28881 type:complete len:238 (+) Transcript_17121:1994-2707(+)
MQMVPEFDWNLALEELENEDNSVLLGLLRAYKACDVTAIIDDKDQTLLHHAVQIGVGDKAQLLINFARKEQKVPEERIRHWINLQSNDEGWTALHFSAFQGNVDAIYTLLENGADYTIKNKNGLNLLHVSAQGDTAPPLYLFHKNYGISLNEKDKRGSTPLHWACYSQSETAIVFILAWSPNVDLKDNEGFTPLHLAVRSVDALESCRPVRALLIKGARTDIRDNRDKLASDYIRDI